ncbi:MAG: hypothetical protein ABIH34_08325 [Nanoarchaeota archaeon]
MPLNSVIANILMKSLGIILVAFAIYSLGMWLHRARKKAIEKKMREKTRPRS